jgi:hypothetical protein
VNSDDTADVSSADTDNVADEYDDDEAPETRLREEAFADKMRVRLQHWSPTRREHSPGSDQPTSDATDSEASQYLRVSGHWMHAYYSQ